MTRKLLRPRASAFRPALLASLALMVTLTLSLSHTPVAAQAETAPRLAYGTFLGGASDDDARAVVVDGAGNIYLAGTTYSRPFPGMNGQQEDTDAFVTKLDPTGRTVLYSILIGGSDDEEGLALAVDTAGNAWVTGSTQSNDLPLQQPLPFSYQGDDDTFVSKLDPSGALLFQTYLGYPGSDRASGLALDPAGNAYLAGEMGGDYGPQVRAAKISAGGAAVVYDVAFGAAPRGFNRGSRASAITVDPAGNAYLAGTTNTGAFDTGGFQDRCVGYDNPIDDCPSDDGFVVILNAAGDALVGGTILGGLGSDQATAVALDGAGNVYVAGTTFSNDFPTLNASQPAKHGPDNFADAFLVKLTPGAAALAYATYYGGEAYEEAHGLVVDYAGRTAVTGLTSSADLAVPAALQPAITGQCVTGSTRRLCYDAFVASFDAAGALHWASYLGGTDDDIGNGAALGPEGDLYLVGRADSLTLPTSGDALQAQRRGRRARHQRPGRLKAGIWCSCRSPRAELRGYGTRTISAA
jgi:hypothetical protein